MSRSSSTPNSPIDDGADVAAAVEDRAIASTSARDSTAADATTDNSNITTAPGSDNTSTSGANGFSYYAPRSTRRDVAHINNSDINERLLHRIHQLEQQVRTNEHHLRSRNDEMENEIATRQARAHRLRSIVDMAISWNKSTVASKDYSTRYTLACLR